MFCPNCGTKTGEGQKYCRACGLSLARIAGLLSEQLSAGTPGRASPAEVARLLRRKHDVERWLSAIGAASAGGFLVAVVAAVFFRQAVEQAGGVESAILLAFTIAGLAALALALYRESLKKSLAAGGVSEDEEKQLEAAAETSKLLPETHFEPATSVTDHTTELLAAERKRVTKEVSSEQ